MYGMRTVKVGVLLLACGLLAAGCEGKGPVQDKAEGDGQSGPKSLADVVGVTHVTGKYHLTDKPFLQEGADQVLALGSRVIKIWFYGKRHEHPEAVYSFNSQWPAAETLVDGAQLPYFKEFFGKDFTTYILVVTSLGRPDDYWRAGIMQEEQADETKQFYELSKYLLRAYRGTGKTFVLQHWEGDWMVRDRIDPAVDPTEAALGNMVTWLAARQAGVTKARREVGCDGVWVWHAAEVNRVVSSMEEGRPNMVTDVLPKVELDLVSYSAWDSATDAYEDATMLKRALDFIADKAIDSEAFGAKNVYVGEFGWPENLMGEEGAKRAVPQAVEGALAWGCPYVVYWQLYCNELATGEKTVPVHENGDVRGFWLLRPDGSKSWVWEYFEELLGGGETGG